MSPVCYPPPYDESTYVRDHSSYFDTQLFFMLLTSGSALKIPFDSGRHHTAVGTWRKRWKHWVGRGASTLKTACRVLDSPFVLCCEKNVYQLKLAALLSEASRRSAVPTLVATDLQCLAEDLRDMYYVANRPY